eukprot:scaffold20225_cov121-Isochrysis_galbana.AAC.4
MVTPARTLRCLTRCLAGRTLLASFGDDSVLPPSSPSALTSAEDAKNGSSDPTRGEAGCPCLTPPASVPSSGRRDDRPVLLPGFALPSAAGGAAAAADPSWPLDEGSSGLHGLEEPPQPNHIPGSSAAPTHTALAACPGRPTSLPGAPLSHTLILASAQVSAHLSNSRDRAAGPSWLYSVQYDRIIKKTGFFSQSTFVIGSGPVGFSYPRWRY